MLRKRLAHKLAGLPVPAACPAQPAINWYTRFINGPKGKPLTPREKAWLAARNVVDPFNGLTILASSAIAVGWDAHSPYGPGMPGFARNVGVSYTLDITGEFFGVFLIPSIAHQDPHYHRLPTPRFRTVWVTPSCRCSGPKATMAREW
jgi:hypothetical protein